MIILGISAFFHDSAAAIINEGEVIAACSEERFSRIKNDASFPQNSIIYCLEMAKINLSDIDLIVFYDKPLLKLDRLIETVFAFAPKGIHFFMKAFPLWAKEKIFQKILLIDGLKDISPKMTNEELHKKLLFSQHHFSHGASAFFSSPYKESLVITLDGVGEWQTTTIGIGNDNNYEIKEEINFPHSLGLLYSTFTYFCGFKVNSGEYKLMGLAPYGRARFKDIILKELIDVKDDGSFRLNMKYFSYTTSLQMCGAKLEKLLQVKKRESTEEITQEYKDLAASIQAVLEKIIEKIVIYATHKYNQKNVCLAGGVALNSCSNGKLIAKKIVQSLWVQPAAGDAGSALGAAYIGYYIYAKKNRLISSNSMKNSYLGPEFTIHHNNIPYPSQELNLELIVDELTKGKVIAYFQGKMEFGPRALGNRSILADPRNPQMKDILNHKIKFRESFRPFAPIVLEEYAHEWFEVDNQSAYMTNVFKVRPEKRKLIPAVTHIDGTARVQTLNKNTHPKLHLLISKFYDKTGCPLLINTSLNIKDEPIVCTPDEALNCFHKTHIDGLILNQYYLTKEDMK
jgi:carbamoyltransferase